MISPESFSRENEIAAAETELFGHELENQIEQALNMEETIIEKEKPISDEERKLASTFGRAGSLLRKSLMLLVLTASPHGREIESSPGYLGSPKPTEISSVESKKTTTKPFSLMDYAVHSDQKIAEAGLREERVIINEELWNQILQDINYQDTLADEAKKFGIIPLKRLGYQRYIELDQDVNQVAKTLNKRIETVNQTQQKNYPKISRGLITATVLQEGLAELINYEGYSSDFTYDTFGIGADALPTDWKKLSKLGLLDKSFGSRFIEGGAPQVKTEEGWEPLKINEAGTPITVKQLKAPDLLEGIGAMLIEYRNKLIDSMGIEDWQKHSQEEQDWLTYAAYNWGPENVKTMIKENVIPVRDMSGKIIKKVPLTNYLKYRHGVPVGKIENYREFIFRKDGLNYKPTKRTMGGDFHYNASQVAISAKIANKFFKYIDRRKK